MNPTNRIAITPEQRRAIELRLEGLRINAVVEGILNGASWWPTHQIFGRTPRFEPKPIVANVHLACLRMAGFAHRADLLPAGVMHHGSR